jgi:hypothetical protein
MYFELIVEDVIVNDCLIVCWWIVIFGVFLNSFGLERDEEFPYGYGRIKLYISVLSKVVTSRFKLQIQVNY